MNLQTLQPGERDIFKIVAAVRRLITAFSGGQLSFPATQVPSTDPNTLDDYEEGTWTPALTFQTVGDLNVALSGGSEGTYTKIGRIVFVRANIVTTTFTHSTAAGNLRITGIPFTPTLPGQGALQWSGITKAGYTNIVCAANAATAFFDLDASGSGVALANVTAADMPTAGTVILRPSIFYEV